MVDGSAVFCNFHDWKSENFMVMGIIYKLLIAAAANKNLTAVSQLDFSWGIPLEIQPEIQLIGITSSPPMLTQAYS